MKKILYTILSVLILTSCSKTEELDGIWFIAYNDFPDYKAEPSQQKTLLEFDGKFVYTIKIGDLSTGDLSSVIIDTALFSFNNSVLQIDKEKLNVIYSQDSIIFNHEDAPQTRTVLKRLNPNFKNKDFKETNFSGSYSISSKFYNDSIDFINDSIVIFTGEYSSNFPVYNWKTIDYGGFKFLNIQNELFPLLMFKSQTDKETTFEYPIQKNKDFIFSKLNIPSLSDNLIGRWQEIKINIPKPLPPFVGIKDGDQYYNLSFTKDSLLINHFGRNEKIRWSLSGANQRIYFIDKIMNEQGSWKILELTKDILTIRISKDSGFNEEIIYLKKENNSR
jgi:putative VirB-like lipoprotein